MARRHELPRRPARRRARGLFFAYRLKFSPKLALEPRLHVDEQQFAQLAKKKAVADVPEAKRSAFTFFKGVGWLPREEAGALRDKARTQTIALLRLGDLAAAAAPIGLFFGRIANFINGELWGRPTDLPWGVIFPAGGYDWVNREWVWYGNEVARHPSQLYEATLEGLVLFAIVNIATLKFDSLRRPGLNAGLFLVFYGLFRALLETVREPDAHMPEALRGVITMGMLLSIPMILAGAYLIHRAYRREPVAA
ncbi:MAG: prolipoprotein diacylglyceryl transferase [Hyphomonadaceae bacterium]